jgi:hypothetical protein
MRIPMPMSGPPYQNEHAAEFSEEEEPTYALIGEILHITDDANVTRQHLLVGEDITYPIDQDFLPIFEFFRTPRSEHQAEEWLEWAGAPAGYLSQLVKLGFLVRIDTSTSWAAAKSLRGLRLRTLSTPGEQRPNGYLSLVSQASGEAVMTVSPELATLLWGNEEGHDIPTAIKKLAKVSGLSKDVIARRVLAMTPMLLEHGYAWLEWLRVPD